MGGEIGLYSVVAPSWPLAWPRAARPATAPQRIPGRLRQLGPLADLNALLEPLDPVELAAWDNNTLLPEGSQL